MFHKHQWIKIKETYYEPRDLAGYKQISEYLAERLLVGLTTIIWECSICHNIKKEEMLGKEMMR